MAETSTGTTTTPETLGGAVVDKSMQTPAAKPPSLDLSSKVKLEDGTEVSVGDLVKGRGAVQELQRAQKAMRSVLGRGEVAEDKFSEFAEDHEYALVQAGYTQAEAKAETEKLRGEWYGKAKEEKTVEKAAVPESFSRLMGSMVNKAITDAIGNGSRESEKLKSLFETVGTFDDKDERAETMTNIKAALRTEIIRGLRQKEASAGHDMSDVGWVDEVFPKAAEAVSKQYAPFLKHIRAIGKVSAGPDPFAHLPEKPVDRPATKDATFDPVKYANDKERWLDDAIDRALKDEMANVG